MLKKNTMLLNDNHCMRYCSIHFKSVIDYVVFCDISAQFFDDIYSKINKMLIFVLLETIFWDSLKIMARNLVKFNLFDSLYLINCVKSLENNE